MAPKRPLLFQPPLTWTSPVEEIRAAGARRKAALNKLGIHTVADVLFHFPRRYEDWTLLRPICELAVEAQEQTCLVLCWDITPVQYRGKRNWFSARFVDATGSLRATWFNQPYYANQLQPGALYLLYGKVKGPIQPEFLAPQFTRVDPPERGEGEAALPLQPEEVTPALLSTRFCRPVYGTTAGLGQQAWRTLVQTALEGLTDDQRQDPLPPQLREKYGLCAREWALTHIHFPRDREEYERARHRFAWEELFFVQFGLRARRQWLRSQVLAPIFPPRARLAQAVEEARGHLPFTLTGAQERVLGEILDDLASTTPMDRLLQGDVGSGKTVIAALALWAAIQAGYQGVLVAPTTILAKQHADSFEAFLSPLGVRIGLLVGGQRAAARRTILGAVERGEVDLLVGTHALFQEGIHFSRLGLVITDEQHRFGVAQRLAVQGDSLNPSEEGAEDSEPISEAFSSAQSSTQGQSVGAFPRVPHRLVMSATPIPRSLALVLYGDLSLSILDEKPPGRQPIATYTAGIDRLPDVWKLLNKTLERGEQAYLVCARREEGEGDQIRAATELFEEVSHAHAPNHRFALLHGTMSAANKTEVMEAFIQGSIRALVSTTVIEVGVDNPNATLLVIFNAERFGLAQLHQLRGRVGRGSKPSICVLCTGEKVQEEAMERLKTFCKTQDGYELAEADLRLRGPGDFFGTRQHGLPEFRIANLYQDQGWMLEAREAVEELLGDKRWLDEPHPELEDALTCYLGEAGKQSGL